MRTLSLFLLGLATASLPALAQSQAKSTDDSAVPIAMLTQMAASMHTIKLACGQITPEQALAAQTQLQQAMEADVSKADFDSAYAQQRQNAQERWEQIGAERQQQACQRVQSMAP